VRAQAIEYVTALEEGDVVPAHPVEVATRELVPPGNPVLSVTTVSSARHRRTP